MSEELKPCPFCGTQPTEYDQVGYSSVKCKPCNFSIKVKSMDGPPYAPELWNTRAELSAIKGGGEAVAWMTPSGNVFNNKAAAETGFRGESTCKVTPLYTHPPVVAEAEPAVCMGCVDLSSHVRELEHKMDYYKAQTAPPASGAVPVTRELLESVADHMTGSSSARVRVWHDQIRTLLAKGVQS